jgi:hypothetical protein
VPSGLITIGPKGHCLASTINQLYNAHQASPLLESLYLVTNKCNHDEYAGKAGFFDDVGRFPRECASLLAVLTCPASATMLEDTSAYCETSCGEYRWQEKHVICNGCSDPSEWAGHVGDLLLAMRHIQQRDGKLMDVLAIDASMFFWPDCDIQV